MKRARTSSRSGQVLILLAGALFIGGSTLLTGRYLTGHDIRDVDKALQDVVDDPERLAKAREVIKTWRKDGNYFHKRTKQRGSMVTELLKSRGTPPSTIQITLVDMDEDTDTTLQRVLDYRFALRELLTAEEWAEVFPPPAE